MCSRMGDKRRITFDLSDVECIALDMMLADLRRNDPSAWKTPSDLVHDIVRSVLEDDFALHNVVALRPH